MQVLYRKFPLCTFKTRVITVVITKPNKCITTTVNDKTKANKVGCYREV